MHSISCGREWSRSTSPEGAIAFKGKCKLVKQVFLSVSCFLCTLLLFQIKISVMINDSVGEHLFVVSEDISPTAETTDFHLQSDTAAAAAAAVHCSSAPSPLGLWLLLFSGQLLSIPPNFFQFVRTCYMKTERHPLRCRRWCRAPPWQKRTWSQKEQKAAWQKKKVTGLWLWCLFSQLPEQ